MQGPCQAYIRIVVQHSSYRVVTVKDWRSNAHGSEGIDRSRRYVPIVVVAVVVLETSDGERHPGIWETACFPNSPRFQRIKKRVGSESEYCPPREQDNFGASKMASQPTPACLARLNKELQQLVRIFLGNIYEAI
jgi:hypothetical protein